MLAKPEFNSRTWQIEIMNRYKMWEINYIVNNLIWIMCISDHLNPESIQQKKRKKKTEAQAKTFYYFSLHLRPQIYEQTIELNNCRVNIAGKGGSLFSCISPNTFLWISLEVYKKSIAGEEQREAQLYAWTMLPDADHRPWLKEGWNKDF